MVANGDVLRFKADGRNNKRVSVCRNAKTEVALRIGLRGNGASFYRDGGIGKRLVVGAGYLSRNGFLSKCKCGGEKKDPLDADQEESSSISNMDEQKAAFLSKMPPIEADQEESSSNISSNINNMDGTLGQQENVTTSQTQSNVAHSHKRFAGTIQQFSLKS